MKDIDTLEAQFAEDLRRALLSAAKGRSANLFSLKAGRKGSTAEKLRVRAERVLELRRTYSTDSREQPLAAKYLYACLRWEHLHKNAPNAATTLAEELLKETAAHAT